MADTQLLGLFQEVASAAEGVERLRQAGIEDAQVSVISGVPYRSRMLRRPAIGSRIASAAGVGALVGAVIGLAITWGTYVLYPLSVGGQPRFPIPPTLIVIFEVTMLGMMWTAFGAFLIINRMPVFGQPPFSDKVMDGSIGILVQIDANRLDEIERLLREGGASEVRRFDQGARANHATWLKVMGGVAAVVTLALVVLLLFSFEVIKIPFPTNMADTVAVAHLQGPRLAAPLAAVPIQGPVFIAGQPAFAPVASSSASIQRGQVEFGITCQMCHGESGQGNGRLATYFNPKPADLTGERVRAFSDSDIYLVISLGRGQMPSLAEIIPPDSRWDVINYVRTLQK
jgi:mono/diheme cytochrome c family protein